MIMTNLIRRYKIHQITPVLNKKELKIIDFINGKINNLTEFKSDERPDSLFFMDNTGKYILEEDHKNKRLWIRYDDFCEVLGKKYKLEYHDIQILIQYIVELSFKRKVYTTLLCNKF
jgi:hypothetical protein